MYEFAGTNPIPLLFAIGHVFVIIIYGRFDITFIFCERDDNWKTIVEGIMFSGLCVRSFV